MAKTRTITVDLYGMTGYGPSKAEAKADVSRKLTVATEGSYMPKMYRFPGDYIGLTYRDLAGWNYSILAPPYTEAVGYCCSGFASIADAERKLRLHVAQNLISIASDNGLGIIMNEGDRQGHREYIAWQERYAAYRAQGYSDNDCHRMACESPAYCHAT